MKSTIAVALILAAAYALCWYAVGPQVHVPGLDGPVSQCKNPNHSH